MTDVGLRYIARAIVLAAMIMKGFYSTFDESKILRRIDAA